MRRAECSRISTSSRVTGIGYMAFHRNSDVIMPFVTRIRSSHLVAAMAMCALLATEPITAQPVAKLSVALSSEISANRTVDNFRIRGTSPDCSTQSCSKPSALHSATLIESSEESPGRVEAGINALDLNADRAAFYQLILPEESDPPKLRSNYVLVGGLIGAVVGASGMGVYLSKHCDDCFLVGFTIGMAGVGGAIVGGIAGSYIFEYKRSRQP